MQVLPQVEQPCSGINEGIKVGVIGIGALLLLGGAFFVGRKLLSSQLPKVQKVNPAIHINLSRICCKLLPAANTENCIVLGSTQTEKLCASIYGPSAHKYAQGMMNNFYAVQVIEQKQLQKEAAQRLNVMVDELRNSQNADLSAKNLGEEGRMYISEGLAFNDRSGQHAYECLLATQPCFLPGSCPMKVQDLC